jgi:hypothetical protein
MKPKPTFVRVHWVPLSSTGNDDNAHVMKADVQLDGVLVLPASFKLEQSIILPHAFTAQV